MATAASAISSVHTACARGLVTLRQYTGFAVGNPLIDGINSHLFARVARQSPLQLEHGPGDLVADGGMALLVMDWRLVVDRPASRSLGVVGRLPAAEQPPTGSGGRGSRVLGSA